MTYNIGDVLEFDSKKEYTILKECKIDEYEYYLAIVENAPTEIIIFKKLEEGKNIEIVKEKEEIDRALKELTK